ncbi:hypothetical protein BS50DRAFT_137085 [Corynespora cassiicola Philippines]|uniref:Uncharacterized protein n=1 Tax=Corynespora cassiicola Philippines TaxID=1448308 RepID=A0A2T2N9F5_CORCC|nr:hypothetical protein BS50DRAFT_137085 [Corynespora cassiicola Philippines]
MGQGTGPALSLALAAVWLIWGPLASRSLVVDHGCRCIVHQQPVARCAHIFFASGGPGAGAGTGTGTGTDTGVLRAACWLLAHTMPAGCNTTPAPPPAPGPTGCGESSTRAAQQQHPLHVGSLGRKRDETVRRLRKRSTALEADASSRQQTPAVAPLRSSPTAVARGEGEPLVALCLALQAQTACSMACSMGGSIKQRICRPRGSVCRPARLVQQDQSGRADAALPAPHPDVHQRRRPPAVDLPCCPSRSGSMHRRVFRLRCGEHPSPSPSPPPASSVSCSRPRCWGPGALIPRPPLHCGMRGRKRRRPGAPADARFDGARPWLAGRQTETPARGGHALINKLRCTPLAFQPPRADLP